MPIDPDKARGLVTEGRRLLIGEGVEQSPQRAAAVLEEAADAGSGEAAALMAVLMGSGVTGRQSWSMALDFLEKAAELGDRTAQQQLVLLADDGDAARRRIDVRTWITPQPAGLLARTPQIAVFPRFIPLSVCRWLIGKGDEDPRSALIYDPGTGAMRIDPLRTNTATRVDICHSDLVLLLVQARIAASVGLPVARMENPNILRYDVGQTFAGHVDFLDPAVPKMKAEIDVLGQRIATFLIYLNDDFEGGETEFPVANLRYRGKPGDAVLFYNVGQDGAPDPQTMHAGLPPTRGRKWLLSQWIRDRPQPIL